IHLGIRGSGMSQRAGALEGFDLERSAILDLDAVADRVGIERFSIFANGPSGMLAMMYAARRPERVDKLVLWEALASLQALGGNSQARALIALFENDYEMYTETLANVFFGWSAGDSARHFARMLREAQTHDEARVFLRAYTDADVSSLLPSITAPTLIIHHRDARLVPMEVARNLAARIPNARLAV